MATRRMFDKTFMESDSFLELTPSAQMLYVHLSLNADDDGFLCNYKGIIRLVGCTDEDFQSLIDREFIIRFKSGVIVRSLSGSRGYGRNDLAFLHRTSA